MLINEMSQSTKRKNKLCSVMLKARLIDEENSS